jgi:hypothetical protein
MQWLVRDAQPNDSLFFHCEYLHPLYIVRSDIAMIRLWTWRPGEYDRTLEFVRYLS